MIIYALISTFLNIVTGPLYVFPPLPDTPTAILNATAWLTDTAASVASFLQYLFTPVLYNAAIAIIISIFALELLYYPMILAMKLIKKVPFL